LKCKFCHNEVAKLVDAHVIPRSFFKLTRGTGKHSVLVGVDEKKLDKKFKQAGISDRRILRETCERLFGPYDKHGFEAVVDLISSKQFACWNPNGIPAISPGLRGTSYLGSPAKKSSTLKGLNTCAAATMQPFQG
jgi:hypothetical protein